MQDKLSNCLEPMYSNKRLQNSLLFAANIFLIYLKQNFLQLFIADFDCEYSAMGNCRMNRPNA